MNKIGTVYLVKPEKVSRDDVYKFGIVNSTEFYRIRQRFHEYGSKSITIQILNCVNYIEVENRLKIAFNDRFRLYKGREWFIGDRSKIIECFNDITRKYAVLSQDVESNDESYDDSDDATITTNMEALMIAQSDSTQNIDNKHNKTTQWPKSMATIVPEHGWIKIMIREIDYDEISDNHCYRAIIFEQNNTNTYMLRIECMDKNKLIETLENIQSEYIYIHCIRKGTWFTGFKFDDLRDIYSFSNYVEFYEEIDLTYKAELNRNLIMHVKEDAPDLNDLFDEFLVNKKKFLKVFKSSNKSSKCFGYYRFAIDHLISKIYSIKSKIDKYIELEFDKEAFIYYVETSLESITKILRISLKTLLRAYMYDSSANKTDRIKTIQKEITKNIKKLEKDYNIINDEIYCHHRNLKVTEGISFIVIDYSFKYFLKSHPQKLESSEFKKIQEDYMLWLKNNDKIEYPEFVGIYAKLQTIIVYVNNNRDKFKKIFESTK